MSEQFILKKQIIERCKKLKEYEYVHLFNLIVKENIRYSKNNNGVFINLRLLSDETISKIDTYLKFVEDRMMKEKTMRDEIRKYSKSKDEQYEDLCYEKVYDKQYQNLNNYHKHMIKNHSTIPEQKK